MAKYDASNEKVIANGINATLSGTTPAKGNLVLATDYDSVTFCLFTGTVTDAGVAGTGNGIQFEIQESDDTADGNFTAVADADLFGTEAALEVILDTADDDAIGMIGYGGSKPYVRVVATGTTGTDAVVTGFWVLEKGQYRPPSAQIVADVAAT